MGAGASTTAPTVPADLLGQIDALQKEAAAVPTSEQTAAQMTALAGRLGSPCGRQRIPVNLAGWEKA